VYSHVIFSSFKSLIWKNSSWFGGTFSLRIYLAIEVGNLIFHVISNGQYLLNASVDSDVLNYFLFLFIFVINNQ
jgi:hypothetical protein